jgi:thiol-disulfide isomerase/thioredoxin
MLYYSCQRQEYGSYKIRIGLVEIMPAGGKRVNTARGMMGSLMDPIDVNNDNGNGSELVKELKKRMKKSPIMILVYATWCPHCHTYKPLYEKLENNPNRTMPMARVRDDMVDAVGINSDAINGYPSVIVVDKNGSVVKSVDDIRNIPKMNSIIENGSIKKNQDGTEATKKNNAIVELSNEMAATPVSANSMPPAVPNDALDSKRNKDSLGEKKNKSLVYFGGNCGTGMCGSASVQVPAPLQAGGSRCGCPFARQAGGSAGLYGLLTSVVNETLPAAALLGTAAYLAKKKRRTSKTSKRKAQRKSKTRKH